eukprot:1591481-Prymnesium_polylepis.1
MTLRINMLHNESLKQILVLPSYAGILGCQTKRIERAFAGARLGQHSAVLGRCLELGSLPALNCGRLATWHRERHA